MDAKTATLLIVLLLTACTPDFRQTVPAESVSTSPTVEVEAATTATIPLPAPAFTATPLGYDATVTAAPGEPTPNPAELTTAAMEMVIAFNQTDGVRGATGRFLKFHQICGPPLSSTYSRAGSIGTTTIWRWC
jgi:hypothetical protein